MSDFSPSKKISRRKFFEVARIFTAASILACSQSVKTQPPSNPTFRQEKPTQPPGNLTGVERIQTQYNLTSLNAQIFWLFIENRDNHLGRRTIAAQLNISFNTLKDHITRIIRHVRDTGYPDVVTLTEAVDVAVTFLA